MKYNYPFQRNVILTLILFTFSLLPTIAIAQSNPPPYNVEAVLISDTNPIVEISWEIGGGNINYFIVRRDGTFVGSTTDLFFQDILPAYGTYCYTVHAVYIPGGWSAAGGPACLDYYMAFVEGIVYTYTSPLEDVLISVASVETYTDVSGFYNLGLVEEGSYIMEFSKPGYFDVIRALQVNAGDTSEMNTALFPINSFAAPTDVSAVLIDELTPVIELSWIMEPDSGYQFTVVKVNGSPIGTSSGVGPQSMLFSGNPWVQSGINCYSVQAYYDQGLSEEVSSCIEWIPPEVKITPDTLVCFLLEDEIASTYCEISNSRSTDLNYTFPGFDTGTLPPGFIAQVNPSSGNIPSYGSDNIYLSFDATGYLPGIYYQDVALETSDTLDPFDTLVCLMHVYSPGYLAGEIHRNYDPYGAPNEYLPLPGVRVRSGEHFTRTLGDGSYSLSLPEGEHVISFEMPGYESEQHIVHIAAGGLISLGDTMWRIAEGVSWITAELDDCANPTYCTVEWGAPIQTFAYIYDDGTAEDIIAWADPYSENAVRISPHGYPARLTGGSVYVGDGTFPDAYWLGTEFSIRVYDEDISGMPGTLLDSITVSAGNYHWIDFSGLDIEVDSGDIFLSMMQLNSMPDCAPLGVDNTSPLENRSYARAEGGDWSFSSQQDLMIRAELKYPSDSTLEFYTIGLRHDFDPENGPVTGLLTILNNVTGNSYIDDSYYPGALPDGFYAYSIQTSYRESWYASGGWPSSNVVGNGVTQIVDFIVKDKLDNNIDSVLINMTHLDWSNDSFTDTTDVAGYCSLACIWPGNFMVMASKAGYDSVNFNATIVNDTLIEIIMDPTFIPPQNLWMDTINIIAYWDTPSDTLNVLDYSVYLDGLFSANTDSTYYQFTNIPFDLHTVCIEANYLNGSSYPACTDFGGGYLPAPDWIEGDSIGSDILLTWYMDTSGFGNALAGFKLYRDSTYFKYIPYVGQDTLTYLDTNLAPMCYDYHVSALYDLNYYGYYMQFGNSELTGPVEVCLVFGTSMPVFEDWSSGSFGTLWTTEDNWVINGQFGNPLPAAEFKWDPILSNYQSALSSEPINGVYTDGTKQKYLDGQVLFEFDLSLVDNDPSGTEYLRLEVWNEGEWFHVFEYSNQNGSFDWETKTLDISQYALGYIFKVRFLVEGESSSNIISWFVDNINVYHFCAQPLNLTAEQWTYYPDIFLEWSPPATACLGYNIYGELTDGGYEYLDYTEDTSYIYEYQGGNIFAFVVSAVYETCESDFSNEAFVFVGVDENTMTGQIRIYPNPTKEKLNIKSETYISKLCLLDLSGRIMECKKLQNQTQTTLDVSSYQPGVYLLRVDADKGRVVRKIIIAR